jgi:outer membrane assembly lipoprotein YfiO
MKSLFFVIGILVLFSSCSRKSEEELLKEAKAAQEQKNYQLAIESYQQLIDRNPNGKYAEQAQLTIATIYNNEMHDFEKAVNAYQKFYSMYPTSKDAPSALFLSGFLLNNELHKLDNARAVYEMFLQKFPDHELSNSAKFELNTLGKDPSQYIQQDVDSVDQASSVASTKAAKK